MSRCRAIALALCLPLLPRLAMAQVQVAASDLGSLSLEQLMEIEVISVARRQQTLLQAAAAVHVLTADDLRRSGARSLPDALRLVPGVQVARIDASKWSVSARGFGGQFANKLLVLLDGRSVYTPLFAGVFWDVQDLLLEDVERIEIIRGPGAALWGANAVNGVINVITRHSADGQGSMVMAGGGEQRRLEVAAARGGRWSDTDAGETTFRVYGKYFDVPAGADSASATGMDDQQMWRSGIRLDREAGADAWMLQSTLYGGESGQTYFESPVSLEPPYRRTFSTRTDLGGGHVLGRWTRQRTAGAETILQAYYDLTDRMDPADIQETRHTGDLDFQHRLGIGDRQGLVWGLGYRVTRDEIDPTFFIDVDRTRRTDHLFSAFAHNEVSLRPDVARLTLGVKLERNSYTGLEVQPDVRFLWTPSPQQALWTSLSRAVRTPARGESEQSITVDVSEPGSLIGGSGPSRIAIENDEPVAPAELVSVQLGWRAHPMDGLLVDVAGYHHRYENLLTFDFGLPYSGADPAHTVLPLRLDTGMKGRATGVEVSTDWQATRRWRLRNSYAFLDKDIEARTARQAENAELGDPRHQLTHWSSLDLSSALEADIILRYVDELPVQGVDAYLDLDLRLGWRPRQAVRLSLGGRSLLDGGRREYLSGFQNVLPTRVERVLYVDATWYLGSN